MKRSYKKGACVRIAYATGERAGALTHAEGRFVRWAKRPTRNQAGTAVVKLNGVLLHLYDTMIWPCGAGPLAPAGKR